MAERKRVFLTGSERAEFEHIFGPLTEDKFDPRFVLVDDETAEKIAALPPGVPVRQGQHPADVAAIRSAELDAFGDDVDASSEQGAKAGSVEAKPLDVEAVAPGDPDAESDEDSDEDESDS